MKRFLRMAADGSKRCMSALGQQRTSSRYSYRRISFGGPIPNADGGDCWTVRVDVSYRL
jgi:hypothetical protein